MEPVSSVQPVEPKKAVLPEPSIEVQAAANERLRRAIVDIHWNSLRKKHGF